jgi:hypothetical protein
VAAGQLQFPRGSLGREREFVKGFRAPNVPVRDARVKPKGLDEAVLETVLREM